MAIFGIGIVLGSGADCAFPDGIVLGANAPAHSLAKLGIVFVRSGQMPALAMLSGLYLITHALNTFYRYL